MLHTNHKLDFKADSDTSQTKLLYIFMVLGKSINLKFNTAEFKIDIYIPNRQKKADGTTFDHHGT